MQVTFPRAPAHLVLLLALLSSCSGALPEHARVRRVIDGDTIELADGRLVRSIGIDTPEVRRRSGDEWILDPEPFGREAAEANRKLVEGRTVRLEFDIERHDRFGRLLAYVYVGDGQDERMANEEMLRAGAAKLLTIPPNVKYVERFQAAVAEARQNHRGLWADADGTFRRRREAVGTAAP